MRLNSTLDEFQIGINTLLQKSALFDKQSIKSEHELQNLNNSYLDWKKEVIAFLELSFNGETNDFVTDFSKSNSFNFPNNKVDYNQKYTQLMSKIKEKQGSLTYYAKIVSISDVLLGTATEKEREKITTEEILDLLLLKLYQLYDNSYHSIKLIADVNGIKFKKYNEERELVKILESRGFVTVQFMRDVLAQLNANGKIYVEKNLIKSNIDYSKISDDHNTINNKIDEILKNIEKLGYGQEIIFDELTEMKDLYQKLDKKSWGQLLKGKLFDLGVEQILDKETLTYVYKELTEQILQIK